MARQQKTKARINALWEHLKQTPDLEQSLDSLVSSLNERADTDDVNSRAVHRMLKLMADDPPWGMQLEFDSKHAKLVSLEQTVLDRRSKERPEAKHQLGRLVWHVLFGVPTAGHISLDRWQPRDELSRKLHRLRQKSTVTLLVDAGTTTRAAIEQLLELNAMPLKLADSGRFLTPSIVTNSPQIADIVQRSRFRRHIGIRIIGGDVRIERGSICGMAAQICLDAWRLTGDVALIGSTGYREDEIGQPAVGCDSLEESRLKSSFIDRAWIRVLLFDSSKLQHPDVSQIFAPIDGQVIDLVITDSGETKEQRNAVAQFRKIARDAGVDVAVLKKA
ncbi:hypothetical protein GC176_27595 [bacterium]|nr:hypothetical protein [bacterium]